MAIGHSVLNQLTTSVCVCDFSLTLYGNPYTQLSVIYTNLIRAIFTLMNCDLNAGNLNAYCHNLLAKSPNHFGKKARVARGYFKLKTKMELKNSHHELLFEVG